jgi:hypothetical protein
MMQKIELVNRALAHIRAATWSPQKWVYAIGHTPGYAFLQTHNYKAQYLLWQAAKMDGVSPPPSAFASRDLQEAYIQMAAAYWDPAKWCTTVREGHKGAPYQYALTRNWKAQVALWASRNAHPVPVPPPPHPDPVIPPNPRLQNVSVGAFSPWDALAWPTCGIAISADPSLDRFVDRAKADAARQEGHDILAWYVPDQVSHERVVEVANRLGTDLIVADCETLYRWKLAYQSGIRNGIYNLTALWEDKEAHDAIASGEFHGMNEFYWNQDKTRHVDNHNLPVDSMQIAVYDGHSDSTSQDAWEPHVPEYEANSELHSFWPIVGGYQQNMTPADFACMPRKR